MKKAENESCNVVWYFSYVRRTVPFMQLPFNLDQELLQKKLGTAICCKIV